MNCKLSAILNADVAGYRPLMGGFAGPGERVAALCRKFSYFTVVGADAVARTYTVYPDLCNRYRRSPA